MEDEAGDRRDEIVNEKLEAVGRHLSLVFHRFLSGEIKGHARISLTVNGRPITAFDPFCRKNPATQVLPEEIVRIGEAERSEEHTSELQSLMRISYAVFCLKNKKTYLSTRQDNTTKTYN